MLAEGRKPGKSIVTATLKDDPMVKLSTKVTVKVEADKNIDKARIYDMADQVFTGGAVKPRPDVWLYGTLQPWAYKLTYENNVRVGYGTVTIEGVKPYYGRQSAKFRIVPRGTGISAFKSNARGIATITWKKQQRQADGYQVRYSLKKGMSKATVKTVSNTSTAKKVIKGLKKGRQYYAQVRTYKQVGGEIFTSPWSKKRSMVAR